MISCGFGRIERCVFLLVDYMQAEAMVVDSGVAGVREEEVEAEEEEVEEVSGIEEVP